MMPLTGVRVLDLTRVLAGPMASQVLAEMGAEVIKVERPPNGDESRRMEPILPGGESGYFFAVNRGKESITIDFGSAAGKQLILDLAATSDIVIENFLPGTLDKLGIGADDLRKMNPGLIVVSNTGFGQSGPKAKQKGYDTIFQAMSGIMHLTGYPDGPPAKVGVPIADMSSSLWIVIAVLAGLLDRQRLGEGGHWDVAMMDVQLSFLAIAASRTFAYGEDPNRTGTAHPGRVPSAAFECREGGWVHISCSDQHWRALCSVLEIDGETAARLATNARRLASRDEVMGLISEAVARRHRDVLVDALRHADVPVGEVNTVQEALADPQTDAREAVATFAHPREGTYRGIRTPLRKVDEVLPALQAPPLLGADTQEVLRRVLGLETSAIERLRRDGALGPYNEEHPESEGQL